MNQPKRKLFSYKFHKHFIKPFLIRQPTEDYNAKEFFSSYHENKLKDSSGDAVTISEHASNLETLFHYNAVENSIAKYFIKYGTPTNFDFLDLGSGTGHWIDFYHKNFELNTVRSIEISKPAVELLNEKFSSSIADFKAIEADFSAPGFTLNQQFDVINAVGVLFHIVNDEQWQQAMTNLSNLLKPNGVIVAGGEFGLVTRNVQFHTNDSYENNKKNSIKTAKRVLVNKRIRSFLKWKSAAEKADLQVVEKFATQQFKLVNSPENHIMVFQKQ